MLCLAQPSCSATGVAFARLWTHVVLSSIDALAGALTKGTLLMEHLTLDSIWLKVHALGEKLVIIKQRHVPFIRSSVSGRIGLLLLLQQAGSRGIPWACVHVLP